MPWRCSPWPPFNLRQAILKVGDTLLLAGPWRTVRRLQKDSRDLLVLNLPHQFDDVLPAGSKAPYAVFTLAVLIALAGSAGIHAILALLFAITVILGLFVVNTANTVLMTPVALAMAKELQVPPTPAGNYGFPDFIRIGLPLTVFVGVISVLMAPWVFPL